MKKGILVLEQQSWPGGAQRVLDVVLDSLINDFNPIVVFPDEGAFSAALREKGIATRTFPLGTYRPGRKSYREMLRFGFRSAVCALKIAGLIHRERIAVVYINGPRSLPAGALAAWLTGRPSLFHLHLVLSRGYEVFLVTRLARRVTRILACSQAAAESLLKRDRGLTSKTTVLYNPVLERLTAVRVPVHSFPDSAPDHVTLGMVGRITEAKGHQLLLNAMSKLRPEIQNKIRLIVVGAPAPGSSEDHCYANRLAEYANHRGLRERILWTGYQPDPGPYYSLMDVLLQPSSSEALGLTILEALQRGIPVIASRTGGIPEIVRDGHNGLLFCPDDEDALVRSLERFVENQSLRDRLAAGARTALDSRFLPEVFKQAVSEIIQELCDSRTLNKTKARAEELATWK